MITGKRSAVLWQVLTSANTQLGFAALGDDAFEQLVLARLVEPTSKVDSLRVLEGVQQRKCLGESPSPAPLSRVVLERHRWRVLLGAPSGVRRSKTGGDLPRLDFDVRESAVAGDEVECFFAVAVDHDIPDLLGGCDAEPFAEFVDVLEVFAAVGGHLHREEGLLAGDGEAGGDLLFASVALRGPGLSRSDEPARGKPELVSHLCGYPVHGGVAADGGVNVLGVAALGAVEEHGRAADHHDVRRDSLGLGSGG